jgi:hypothetical protein
MVFYVINPSSSPVVLTVISTAFAYLVFDTTVMCGVRLK